MAAYHHGDYPQAVSDFRQSAKQGVAVVQNNLGVMYDHGQGVPQNYAKADLWLRKAAAGGGKTGREADTLIRDIEKHHSTNSEYAECLRNQQLAIVMGVPPATCIP